jgi:hypothetical protein
LASSSPSATNEQITNLAVRAGWNAARLRAAASSTWAPTAFDPKIARCLPGEESSGNVAVVRLTSITRPTSAAGRPARPASADR